MPARPPKPKTRPKDPSLGDAVIDEFLEWMEVDHDDRHRRMEKLHKELDKTHGPSSTNKTGTS